MRGVLRRITCRIARRVARPVPTRAGLLLTMLALAPAVAGAQQFNPRDDRYRALGLMRAGAEYQRASAEWQRARELRARDLLSAAELEERAAARTRARVDLLQQALAALDASPHVLIERARKRRLADGETQVELVLAGAPEADGDVVASLAALDSTLRDELALRGAGRLLVSVKAAAGADGIVIATPYERVLPRLGAGMRRRVTFRLVRDAADVVLSLDYGGRVEERRILLEGDGGSAGVALEARQLAQEADLGTQAAFDVTLERLRDDVSAVRVALEGLPAGAQGEVRAADGDARLSLVRFALGEREKPLRVLVALPRAEGGGVHADTTLRFGVAAAAVREGSAASDAWARVGLELVPRGVPRAELRVASGWVEARGGEEARITTTVRNAGSRALAGVRVAVEAPVGWRAQVVPAAVPALPAGGDAPVQVTLVADAATSAGDYEIRLRLEGGAGERPLESEPRVVRVRVAPAGWSWVPWTMALLLAAIVVAATRAARRLMTR